MGGFSQMFGRNLTQKNGQLEIGTPKLSGIKLQRLDMIANLLIQSLCYNKFLQWPTRVWWEPIGKQTVPERVRWTP